MAKDKYRILIVGGGTAGWMTASALALRLPKQYFDIRLIESEQIGTVGVGESTIPHIRQFNDALGIDESEFLRQTHATFKLGIQFNDWNQIGDSYIHPFGKLGKDFTGIAFHQLWNLARQQGLELPIDQFSVAAQAAMSGRFSAPKDDPSSFLSTFSYSYHLDATAYAQFLRKDAEKRGVTRCEGNIIRVKKRRSNQHIRSVALEDGRVLEADFFVDCSGFKGVVIDHYSEASFIDWQHWLPTNRAVVAPCEKTTQTLPYTKASAKEAGWQWQIPLQHRIGNGYVFSHQYIDDQEALETFCENVPGKLLAEPRFIHFKAGRRKQMWVKNCAAIGLSAGFLEPLESTSIFLIQVGIAKLLHFLPSQNVSQVDIDEYNHQLAKQYETVRDFIILHYKLTQRDDSAFWQYCRDMEIPPSLQRCLDLFSETGFVDESQYGVWPAVCIGQGLVPTQVDSRALMIEPQNLVEMLKQLHKQIRHGVSTFPMADQYIQRCLNHLMMQQRGMA